MTGARPRHPQILIPLSRVGKRLTRRTAMPPDFDRELWLDPLAFFGLTGHAVASGFYFDLFRPDGFAKSKAELWLIPKAREYLEREGVISPLPLAWPDR